MNPVDANAVRSNYSEVGVVLIEELYGTPGYLSPGGAEATDALAAFIDISETSDVLDVGSGLGGPAMRLSGRFGCRVTGVELVESSVRIARERARERGLQHLVDFRAGDATAMPFADGSFSIVWSQDAWCHVSRKEAVVRECARLMRPGGTLAFTDWLLTGTEDDDYHRNVLPALSSPGLESLSGYRTLLERYGFAVSRAEDVSTPFAARYRSAMERIAGAEDEITRRFGPRVFSIVLEKNQLIADAIAASQLGGGRFVATLPARRPQKRS